MPNSFFERGPIRNAQLIASDIAKMLNAHHAMVYAPGPTAGKEVLSAIISLVQPTINMIHSAYDMCSDELQESKILPAVREAYRETIKGGSEPENDLEFVESLIQMSLEDTVGRIIERVDGENAAVQSPANVMAAHSIVDRVSSAMGNARVQVTYNQESGEMTNVYFAATPDGKKGEQISYERYRELTNSPQFRIVKKGIEDNTGLIYYLTVGGKLLMRDDDDEIDEVDLGDIDWDTVDISDPTSADTEAVRSYLAADAAMSGRAPAGGGTRTDAGVVTAVSPTYITLDGRNVLRSNVISVLPLPGSRYHLLLATQELLDEAAQHVAALLQEAFQTTSFAPATVKSIVGRAGDVGEVKPRDKRRFNRLVSAARIA
jgi:hypothetical protein